MKGCMNKYIWGIIGGLIFLSGFSYVGAQVVTQSASIPEAAIAESFTKDVTSLNQELTTINRDITRATRDSTGYASLVSKRDQVTKDLTKKAENRKYLMMRLAEKDPRAFLRLKIPAAMRGTLPTAAQAHIERDTTLQGSMEVIHVDDFENPENSINFLAVLL